MRKPRTYRASVSVSTNHLEVDITRLFAGCFAAGRRREYRVRSLREVVEAFEACGFNYRKGDELLVICSSSIDFPGEYTADPCVLDLIKELVGE